MFYWTECHCHGNAAGNKPALNNGFDLFSENPVIKFFPSFVSRKLRKVLAYWHWSREILTERSSVILCFLNMPSVRCQFLFAGELPVFWSITLTTKFHEILTSGSVEISTFPRNHAVTIVWLTAHALHLRGFSIFLNPHKQSQIGRVFSKRITFNTLNNKRFYT